MRFALGDEHRQLARTLHDLLSSADVPSVARAWAGGEPEPGLTLYARLAEVGVAGLAVPERFGGLGAGPVELVVAFDELGHHPVPGPLVESVAVVPALLAGLPAGERWLPGLAGGEPATVALPPHTPFALDADVATVFAVVDGGVHLATAGRRHDSVDPARRLFEAEPGERLGDADAAFDLGVLCAAAQLLGLGRGLLDLACVHATARRQFGRPVGAFQAVKHELADVLVALELARPLVHGAAVTGTPADVSAARVAAAEAADRAARVALQVHGAVGYTREHDLGLWLTKVRALRSAWGTQSWHRARVLEEITAPASQITAPASR
ncbi:acyl-CoA dehydrogenase family protein [Actinophytocola xanthii]|uniref:Acyl-CoA dehydrogenase n=1 Tax=Actinophytocola xanthii TaxID=1912961 RepID=A0A1Q8CX98_9PSEU|nr:acyl-CoA dehydrogenase family protein [Actinophytocola xanthii]OLF18981.1 acyl-CoA dehydrogenase [Actinophytocola xanthii]